MELEATESCGTGRPRRGFRRNLVDLLYRLRTEADSPLEQALAYGAGAFIGSLPVYGLHLPLCLVAGKMLRLNRIKMFLASNLNNPIVGPFLITAEIQVGSLLRRGQFYEMTPAQLRRVDLVDCLGDLVLGSLVFGCVLGVIFTLLAYVALRQNARDRYRKLLVESTARRFLACGYWQWEKARARLRLDPVYVQLATGGLLPKQGRLLDLGCGRGTQLAVLAAYRELEVPEPRPADWASPPDEGLELVGIEGRSRPAAIARKALEGVATVDCVDLETAELPRCAALLLIDSLRHLDGERREAVLERVADALEPGGVLVMRERSRHPRTDWVELLEAHGFEVAVVPLSRGRGRGKILLRAQKRL